MSKNIRAVAGNGGANPLLAVAGLRKRFGRTVAVHRADFDLAHNSFVTVLGPSGCGKTTILRTIGGFESPTSGEIRLDGRDIAPLPPHRRPVNTVFQSYALFPHMTVAENVAFGLRMRRRNGDQNALIARALDTVQMAALGDRYPAQLSGGQQQRVALARAFINEPRILLLDEPLSALDRKMRKQMQLELKDLQRRLGMTFLYVTHDQEEAFALSDWLIVMNHGVIEQQGPPTHIYHRPTNGFVADFIGGANLIPATIAARQEGDTATADTPFGPVTCPALPALASGDKALLSLRPEQLSPASDGGLIRGTATHVVFQGSDCLIELDTAGLRLMARVPEAQSVAPGAALTLAFDPARAWLTAPHSETPDP